MVEGGNVRGASVVRRVAGAMSVGGSVGARRTGERRLRRAAGALVVGALLLSVTAPLSAAQPGVPPGAQPAAQPAPQPAAQPVAQPAAQPGVSGPGAVARAFFDALASGNAERFEAMATERFSPDLLARRSAADRQQLLARITADFGALTLVGMRRTSDEGVTLVVRGASGLEGRFELTLEAAPPHRITTFGVEVGDQEAGPPPPPPPPITGSMTPADLDKSLDAYLTARAAAGDFAGVVAIAKSGRTIFERAYGLADRDVATPVTPATRFNIASIGKAFTKVAIGQLVAAGRLSLTDTIGALLPDYPNARARPATVDQLLNHQAGIANFFGPAFDATPKDQFVSNAAYFAFVAPMPLTFDPGAGRQYCNGCYVVLGEIIARVSGQPYEAYIAEHVFKPAGMTGAGFFRSDRPPANVAQGYTRQQRGGPSGPGAPGALRNARDAHGVAGSAGGGSYATAADLLAFDAALRDGRLLDAKMTAWFFEAESPAPGTRARGGIGIAGGAPGANAVLEADEAWAVAVVGNLDPPAASGVGLAIKRQFGRQAP